MTRLLAVAWVKERSPSPFSPADWVAFAAALPTEAAQSVRVWCQTAKVHPTTPQCHFKHTKTRARPFVQG